MKKLRLCRYHFGHSPETVWEIWDFSRLESLTLWGDYGGLRPFLLAVHGTSLPCLKIFALSTFARIDEFNVAAWTSPSGLSYLLREFIAHLPPMQELFLDVQDSAALLPGIIKHGKTLRKLEFLYATPISKTIRLMGVKDLEIIQKQLPELVTLQCNVDVPEEHVRLCPISISTFAIYAEADVRGIANAHLLRLPTVPKLALSFNGSLNAPRGNIHRACSPSQ
jgi:hypothetical protein